MPPPSSATSAALPNVPSSSSTTKALICGDGTPPEEGDIGREEVVAYIEAKI
jgi:hypothetical protein